MFHLTFTDPRLIKIQNTFFIVVIKCPLISIVFFVKTQWFVYLCNHWLNFFYILDGRTVWLSLSSNRVRKSKFVTTNKNIYGKKIERPENKRAPNHNYCIILALIVGFGIRWSRWFRSNGSMIKQWYVNIKCKIFQMFMFLQRNLFWLEFNPV